ncbi:MAG TPA: hypothetical protein VFH54_11815, partial [Mycobacteriales bacterium]|nr:hypothetical protein [Mycobacteriales bacterium]
GQRDCHIMYDAMDAETWTIVIGVVLGFFALPVAMFAYDLRRQRQQREEVSADVDVADRL